MTTIIKFEDVQQGDKLRVTTVVQDVEFVYTGVAHHKGNNDVKDWRTKGGIWLGMDYHKDTVIELLDRPKSPEEALKERRDKLVQEFAEGLGADRPNLYRYSHSTDMTKAAVDRIIKLEDEAKESL